MAAVLQAGTGQADVGTLASRGAIRFPFEYCERSRADLALFAIVLLDHLDVWVFGETAFADGREVCGLPAGAI